MTEMIAYILLLVGLFLILGKGADLLINNLRQIAKKVGINSILIGIVLGFFTNIPELAIGINAVNRGLDSAFLGNIWGGIIVLFTLVLGLAIIFNQETKTRGKLYLVIPSLAFILISMLIALDGRLDWQNGLLILFLYCLLIYIRIIKQAPEERNLWQRTFYPKKNFWLAVNKKFFRLIGHHRKELIFSLVSIAIIVVSSHWIVKIALSFLDYWQISPFVIGLLLFSVGTNLPELTIAIRSAWQKKDGLPFPYLMGAATNAIAIIGFLSLFHTFRLEINQSLFILIITTIAVFIIVSFFYVTKRSFSRWEGLALLGLYFVFAIYQLLI